MAGCKAAVLAFGRINSGFLRDDGGKGGVKGGVKQPTTRVEHDGTQWLWWRTEASGEAQSSTVGAWRRFQGHILY